MALFDFEVLSSGVVQDLMDPASEPPVFIEAQFTSLFGDVACPCRIHLNGHIMASGFEGYNVGGMVLAGPDVKIGTVLAHDEPNHQVCVSAEGGPYDCHFAPAEGESFSIGDPVVIFEHFQHHVGHFGEIVWFVTKKTLTDPGIVSINLDILGAGGSGIGRINICPYTGVVHYGSGMEP